jgi:hypothetical protein
MTDECQCSMTGWCDRLQRTMTPHLHKLCQTSPEYRNKFAGQPVKKAEKPTRDGTLPCVHRGEVVKEIECTVCGLRGKTAEVHACEVRGECTLRRAVLGNKYAICLVCPQHKSPDEVTGRPP